MIDVRSSQCNSNDCTKRATFGYEHDNIKISCSQHKKPDMIDLNNKKKSTSTPKFKCIHYSKHSDEHQKDGVLYNMNVLK